MVDLGFSFYFEKDGQASERSFLKNKTEALRYVGTYSYQY